MRLKKLTLAGLVASFAAAGSAMAQSPPKFPTLNAKFSACLDRALPAFSPWHGSVVVKQDCNGKNPVDCIRSVRAHGRLFGEVANDATGKLENQILIAPHLKEGAINPPLQAAGVHHVFAKGEPTDVETAIFARAQASFGQPDYARRLKEAYDAAHPEPTETYMSGNVRITRGRPASYWVMEGSNIVWRRSEESAIHPGTRYELDNRGMPGAVFRISKETRRFPLTIYNPDLWTVYVNISGDAVTSKLFHKHTRTVYDNCIRPLMRQVGLPDAARNVPELVIAHSKGPRF